MYNTTGTSHKNGIENEEKSQKFLASINAQQNVSIDVLKNIKKIESFGGTKNKTDTKILYDDGTEKLVSNKNFSVNGSSFDYANISSKDIFGKISPIEEYRLTLNQKIQELKKQEPSEKMKNEFKTFRKEQANLSLEKMEDWHIRTLLEEVFSPLIDHVIMITDRENKKFQFIETSELEVVKFLLEVQNDHGSLPHFFLKKKRKNQKVSESRSVHVRYFDESGQLKEKDLQLRVRLVTNNGDSAAIGLNKGKNGKNQHSSPVVKIQQDSVKDVLKKFDLPNCSIPFEEEK